LRKCSAIKIQPPTAETSNTRGLSGLDAIVEDPGWQAALAVRLSLLDLGDHASSVACSSNRRKEFKPRSSGTVPTEAPTFQSGNGLGRLRKLLFWRPICLTGSAHRLSPSLAAKVHLSALASHPLNLGLTYGRLQGARA